MIFKNYLIKNTLPSALTYFVVSAPLFNFIALFQLTTSPWFWIVQGVAFLYLVLTPGLFTLSLLTKKKFPIALGGAFSVAISLFVLMVMGLLINTFLPLLGISAPLSTVPLLIGFDLIIITLFSLNAIYKREFALEIPSFDTKNTLLLITALSLPVFTCLGALILNNGGTSFFTMVALCLSFVLASIIILAKKDMHPAIPPLSLYMMAVTFLLMNAMRGWFITGHDILLEYHVFIVTNMAHLWDMNFYRDPYMACLSLTILPTYVQQLLHVDGMYIFKFFMQFFGGLQVIAVYYLTKEYISEKMAFMASLFFITFPTFLVDMAFLNRQGMAFLFFSLLIFVLLTNEYFNSWKRNLMIFLLGIGIIITHYSTSYVAIAVLVSTYFVNRIIRFLVNAKKPKWFTKLTDKLGNKEMYKKPILITFPVVFGLLALMVIWSSFITKTSTSLVNTIHQIIESVQHPFSGESTGPAKYSLIQKQQQTPEELLKDFVDYSIKKVSYTSVESEFYPKSVIEKYSTYPVPELSADLTALGKKIESLLHIDLGNFFNATKQTYAKIIQIFLLVGLIGIALGYSFRKNILQPLPVEYIALSISGLIIMVGQTVLPGSAIDYGLLRLFQQNLVFLLLPVILGLVFLCGLIVKDHRGQQIFAGGILLYFFLLLSGFVPQLTGGARPLLYLNNYGLYYDSYYVHAEEVASTIWMAEHGNRRLPIQAAHFSDIKMIAFGRIGAYIELLPVTTKKKSYVYLNYDNVQTNNIIEIVNGNVVYYAFPMEFLNTNKNMIYNNGGSIIYR